MIYLQTANKSKFTTCPHKKNHRAFYISSSKTIFYKELANIKQTLIKNNFPDELVNLQIKLEVQNINKSNNSINTNNTNRINLYYRNQMHYNYKLDEQAITNIIKTHIKPIEKRKQIKLIIYYTKFTVSNLIAKNRNNSAKIHLNQTNVVYEFICLFREYLLKNRINTYIGYTTTTLSRRLINHLSENCTVKQHLIIKHNNSTNQHVPM